MTGAVPPPSWSIAVRAATPASTRAVAGAVAGTCRAGDVVLLAGGLGAGKTTFAQGFAAALGVTGPVTSPTFTLVREYRCPPSGRGRTGPAEDRPTRLLHADVYRLETLAEVEDLALPESVEDGAVALVEWGDTAAPALGRSSLTVVLERADPPADAAEPAIAGAADGAEARLVTLEGRGPGWTDRVGSVSAALAPFAPEEETGQAGARPAGGPA